MSASLRGLVVETISANEKKMLPLHPNQLAILNTTIPQGPCHYSLLIESHSRPQVTLKRPLPRVNAQGLSPKKQHEVQSTVAYLLQHLPASNPPTHIVDVGAGQAYLTRELRNYYPSAHILALDSNPAAATNKLKTENITHRTLHITRGSLLCATSEWVQSTITPQTDQHPRVLFIALHACGSLTPAILRTFVSTPSPSNWSIHALLVVGCCYNLIDPIIDFPLSKTHPPSSNIPPIPLSASALQLAAQTPYLWLATPQSRSAAELAIRKIVWRALLQRRLLQLGLLSNPSAPDEGDLDEKDSGALPTGQRIGRLPPSAYTSTFENYLVHASARLGISPPITPFPPEQKEEIERLEQVLACAHVMRCNVGVRVEEAIIDDRVAFLQEELSTEQWVVERINLYDQATGSARNVAIVALPKPNAPI